MMSTVPSTPASAYGNGATGTPLRILNKGPKYFRNSNLRGSGSENRRKTAAERLEADKFKYVKSEEVRQRRFTLELRTSSPPNNDSTGAQSMGTASTGSPINMEEDDDITAGNDVIGDFTTEAIIQTMANFTKVKSQNATPVSSRRQQSRPSSENSNTKPVMQVDNSAEKLHSITAARRLQRLKNKALRSPEKEGTRSRKNDNVTPPSPLITRLRERLHSTNSGHSSNTITGNAFTPSPSVATTAENSANSQSSEMKTTETESKSRDNNINKPVHGGKSSISGNALNNYFTKAKEGIKNVASLRSMIGLDRDHNSDRSKERQSRSMTPSSGRRYRSASAGPNLLKSVQSNPRVADPADPNKLSPSAGDAHPIMSPRTQLKHVRENLKKVKIGNDRVFPRKHTTSEASVPVEYMNGARKVTGVTFTVNPTAPKRAENLKSPTEDTLMANHEEAKVESKPPLMPRPKKEKENMQRTSSFESQPKYFEVLKKRSSSASSKEANEDSIANTQRSEVRRSNSNRVKRRSWDILQSTENTTASKSSADEISLPSSGTAMETENTNSQSNARPRRPRSYQHSEQKRNNQSSRMSLPEDAMQPFKDANSHLFQKTGSRKSVAEAIEEIIAPVLRNDDAVVNRNSAASPDAASMDENTLVANRESFYGNWSVATTFGTGGGSITSKNTNNKSSGSVAENINFALTGAIDEQFGSVHSDSTEGNKSGNKPKSSSPYTRSKATVARKLNEKEASSTELLTDSSGKFTKSTTKPPSFFDSPTNSAHLRTVPMRQHSAPTGDSAKVEPPPQSNAGTDDGNLEEKSPRLAPKSRREVIPEARRTSSHNKAEDTLKSHTSSSGSGDAAKPFTALTASDLKPRSNRNNRTIVPQSAPVKPTFAFPGQPVSQTRHNPKRHTTTPVSPTLSPNKQPARMTPPHTPTRSCSSTPYSSLKRTPTSSRSSSLKRNRHRGSKSDSPHHNELDRFFSTMGMGDYMTLTSQPCANETIYSNHWSSESDFSFAGASAYVRDSPDEAMDIDPVPPQLLRGPQSVSIIEKNARVMRWLMSCQKNRKNSAPSKPSPREGDTSATSQSPPVSPVATSAREPPLKPSHQLLSTYPPQSSPAVKKRECPRARSHSHPDAYPASPKPHVGYTSSPPPIPPRTYQRQRGVQPGLADDGVFAGPKESNV